MDCFTLGMGLRDGIQAVLGDSGQRVRHQMSVTSIVSGIVR